MAVPVDLGDLGPVAVLVFTVDLMVTLIGVDQDYKVDFTELFLGEHMVVTVVTGEELVAGDLADIGDQMVGFKVADAAALVEVNKLIGNNNNNNSMLNNKHIK